MTKVPPDIVAELMANISAPTIVSDIDKAIVLLDQQREELVALRKMALRRQGMASVSIPPITPTHFAGGPVVADERLFSLIARYKADPNSPYHNLRFKTREHYDTLLKRIEKDIGQELVSSLELPRIEQVLANWSAGGKLAMAHSLFTMLRILATYGASDPNNRASRELKMNLQYINVESPKSQIEALTPEQADLVIAKAHEMGFHSLALAQAFQTDLKLKQKDVIGEWVPITEPVESDVVDGGLKWIDGLRWEEIDQDFVLRHPTSKGSKVIELSLKDALRVNAEFDRAIGATATRESLPYSGPVIIRDSTMLPWRANEFRRVWRRVADRTGLPKYVKNGG